MKPELLAPSPPEIHFKSALPEEAEKAAHIRSRVRELERYNRDIASSQFLYEVSKDHVEEPWSREFTKIAARDVIMSLYHYSCVLNKHIVDTKCSFISEIDLMKIRSVRKQFNKLHPTIDRFRNALAHSGEMNDSLEKSASHAIKNPEPQILAPGLEIGPLVGEIKLENCFFGNRYAMTFRGEFLQVEMTTQTLRSINQLSKEFYSAFPFRLGTSWFAA